MLTGFGSMTRAGVAVGRFDTHGLATWSTVAVGAMLGGGIANLTDRIVRSPGPARGAVVDWIAIDPHPRISNLADVGLRVERRSSSWG